MKEKKLQAIQNELVFAADRMIDKTFPGPLGDHTVTRQAMLRERLMHAAKIIGEIRVIMEEGEEL